MTKGLIRKKYIIVGAGFGGLGMAVALKQSGEDDFLILEKRGDIGGVWRDNTYPGCTCDVPSHLYSFSFAPYKSRDERYPSQQSILEYLSRVAADYGLKKYTKLDSAVLKARFCQFTNEWSVHTSSDHYRADVVIFAAGQLHQPNYPHFTGLDRFEGYKMHSAAWDHKIDLRGKRIGVIGTGSSAVQMLPKLADLASELTIYQRSPQWVLPKPQAKFNRIERLLLGLPGAHRCYREALSLGADVLLSPIPRCRAWRHIVQTYAKYHLARQVSDGELAKKLRPVYPIGSKRIILDNHFYSTLQRQNVNLITQPIRSINKNTISVEREKGSPVEDEIKTDVMIFATGFRASNFLLPISIQGRDGHCLEEDWKAGAEAFLGLAIWGYPNLFMLAGPNSFNPAGSNPEMKELQIAYIIKCLQWKQKRCAAAIEVSQNAVLQHQDWLRSRIGRTVWPQSVHSWYKHDNEKVTNPWPTSRRSYGKMLRGMPDSSFLLYHQETQRTCVGDVRRPR